MRGAALIAAILFGLPGAASAQKQVELSLGYSITLPKEVDVHLAQADRDACCGRQNIRYLTHFNNTLHFWKFTAAQPGQETLKITVKPDGTSNPSVRALVEVQPRGNDLPDTVWSAILYTNAEWNTLRFNGSKAPAILEEVGLKLNAMFLEADFKKNIKPLFDSAWVGEGVVELEEKCLVGLPLPWAQLKGSAQSVFRIECNKPDGDFIDLEAHGLARSHIDKNLGEILLAKSQQAIKGLKAQRIFVTLWRQTAAANPNLDVVRSCP